jgi:hypothetical protein
MATNSGRISALIGKVILRRVRWALDDPDRDLGFTLRVAPPVEVKSLPTFDPRKKRPLSPMLRERFAFASSLTVGFRTWLAPGEMAKAMADRRVLMTHRAMREHWEGSAPNLYPDDALTLFTHDPELPEDPTYLVWKDPDREPEVWEYHSQDSTRFKSLKTFLRWHAEG